MFQIKINENEYYVFGENEFTICSELKNPIITCPNYYNFEIINGKYPIIRYTNIEPVIINKASIDTKNYYNINVSFGIPLTNEEHQILYEFYLTQIKENPTEEYLEEKNIRNDIETAKTLVKKERQ